MNLKHILTHISIKYFIFYNSLFLGCLPKEMEESGCLSLEEMSALDRYMLHCLHKFQVRTQASVDICGSYRYQCSCAE